MAVDLFAPKVGEWRVTDDGRIGQVYALTPGRRKVYMQMGSGGPFESHWWRKTRPASEDEIREMEGR